ncbi:hypothetical protein B0H16DRAFT_1811871 [Mycena metata]|uniref:Uncharacterized protein n=1 Tax=Mycena metata TaxID=1033252 RepID=A0AAD7H5Y2_9AGAR|nr:hypothetical protein B0H16DRAFT_1811871 [Mycena metata]
MADSPYATQRKSCEDCSGGYYIPCLIAHSKLLCSIHDLRTLDCDTTFKPVAGKMQIFEINGWLVAINESVTVMRVWMEVHDRATYKTVWEEIQRLVLKLTKKQLKFKGRDSVPCHDSIITLFFPPTHLFCSVQATRLAAQQAPPASVHA